MKITNFRDLDAWNVAMELALQIYDAVNHLPAHERYEMSGQMRRAAVSIPSNVAEGHATGLRKRYRHHVRISLGSLAELMTCVELARRLEYLSSEQAHRLQADMERTSQLLHGVLRNIRRQLAQSTG